MDIVVLPDYYDLMQHVSINDGYVSGFVNKESLQVIVDLHCKDTCHHYVASHLTDFEKRHLKSPGAIPRVMWQYKAIPFTGTPFRVKSYREHRCQFGVPYISEKRRLPDGKLPSTASSGKDKDKGIELHIVEEEHSYKRKRKHEDRSSEKSVCQGKIKYRELIRYPQFEIENDVNKRAIKFNIMDKLKAALLRGDELQTEAVYYLSIPLESAHNHSDSASVHPMLVTKIQNLVTEGFVDLNEIKKSLRKYVNNELKKNLNMDTSNSNLFNPGTREIRRIVRQIIEKGVSGGAKSESKLNNSCEVILAEMPDNGSLSKLLATQGIQIYTVPEAESTETLVQHMNSQSEEMELIQVSQNCEAESAIISNSININTVSEIEQNINISVVQESSVDNASIVVIESDELKNEVSTLSTDSIMNNIEDTILKLDGMPSQ